MFMQSFDAKMMKSEEKMNFFDHIPENWSTQKESAKNEKSTKINWSMVYALWFKFVNNIYMLS